MVRYKEQEVKDGQRNDAPHGLRKTTVKKGNLRLIWYSRDGDDYGELRDSYQSEEITTKTAAAILMGMSAGARPHGKRRARR